MVGPPGISRIDKTTPISITPRTGKKLDRAIMVVLALGLALPSVLSGFRRDSILPLILKFQGRWSSR